MGNNFSEIFKQLRNTLNLTQSELAKNLNTTQRKISYWEMGKTEPCLDDLMLIALFFNVTVDYLIGLEKY